MKQRGIRWLDLFNRVFVELSEQWTEESARDVAVVLEGELEKDYAQLYDEFVRVTAGDGLGVSCGHLSTAKERAKTAITQELELLVLKHDRSRVPLLEAMSGTRYQAARMAWSKSIGFMNAKPPDLENGVSEAIAAVEAVARLVVADPKSTLGDAIKLLRQQGKVEAPLLKGFEELWGYSSNAQNVRHGGGAGQQVQPEVARYVVDSAAACLRLLLARDVS